MILSELFEIKYGEFNTPINKLGKGSVPLISSGGSNNGVVGFFDISALYKNVISVARTGSVGETYYHSYDCVINSDCMVLTARKSLTEQEIYWYVFMIRKMKNRFSYARKITPTRLGNISLPNEIPSWVGRIDINKVLNLTGKVKDDKVLLSLDKWKKFRYDDIFEITNGCYNKKPSPDNGGSIPFVGASEFNNGITSFHDINNIKKIYPGNSITVANDGNSVASAFFQPKLFTCSHSINVLTFKDKNIEMNKYIALFLCTLIKLEKYRWSYGRKWRPKRMPDSEIRLPIDEKGNPDYSFMEDYIKSLPYSASL